MVALHWQGQALTSAHRPTHLSRSAIRGHDLEDPPDHVPLELVAYPLYRICGVERLLDRRRRGGRPFQVIPVGYHVQCGLGRLGRPLWHHLLDQLDCCPIKEDITSS